MKKYHLINNLAKLEKILERNYDIPNREEFSKYIFQHPLRFTPYLLEQIKAFPAIAAQYVPDPEELNSTGLQKPFVGQIQTKIPGLERMYLDRVILMPSSQCFAYCRFCFRKNYSHDVRDGDYASPQENFTKAMEYISNDERIKEVLITGGDPLMFPEKVLEIITDLRKIPHLTSIRIGTRIFTSDPELITDEWIKPFQKLNKVPKALPNISDLSAPISISPHINHPDELSPETIVALLLCTQNKIPLYNQTVLLKGINDEPELLIDLNRKLRQLGVEPYRIYLADPLEGSEHFRNSIKEFMDIKKYMRAQASGRIVPSFIIDTRIGKVELEADSELLPRQSNNHRRPRAKSIGHSLRSFIKTPYTPAIYKSVNPDWKIPAYCQLSDDGHLIVEYEDAALTFPQHR